MRWWLPPQAERKPAPAPAQPDERIPLLIGTLAWLAVFAGTAVFAKSLLGAADGRVFWTIVVGLVLGLAGILYTWRRAR